MNERIKELMEQAGLHDFVVESMGIDEEMNKFAKLIVRKCAYMVEEQQRSTGSTDCAKMLCNKFDIEYNESDYYGRDK